jgi:hypothetical protein
MREINETKKQLAESRAAGVCRKPYATPKLEVFGRIRDLTMTGAGSITDGALHRKSGG